MAYDKVIQDYDVQPTENEARQFTGVKIQQQRRVARIAEDGKVLAYGHTVDVGEPLIVPASKLSDLIRELADWPIYFATGQAGADL